MLEIALMQRLALYLGHPSYSIAVVMGAILLATGIGSTLGNRIADPSKRVTYSAIFVAAFSMFLASRGLPQILNATIGLHVAVKILITCALIGPLAVCLGTFFPTGLDAVARSRREFVPWAWGINSGFTVIGSVLAVVLAMWLGFSNVILLASAVYLTTPLLFANLAAKCEAPSPKAGSAAEVVASA
ncbi:MAG TPA: hypothetical protein VFN67_34110 [Polyangiales bacterium]|nr:hypothetical protein [Polyangiales bacterium]